MAGLIGLTAADIDVQDALGAVHWNYDGEWVPHPVVRLTTTLPVAVDTEAGRTVVRARWGFPVGGGRPIGNARDDRLTESRMWKSMLGKGHCLFAATGIYEMIKTEGSKQSYWFRRRDGRPIVMPGLVGERNMDGEKRLCGVIITTAPDDFFAQYHDRQVCALDAEGADAWMAARDVDDCIALLAPPPNDAWEAVPVDDRIFAKGRREMEDLVPVGEPERWGDTPRPSSRQATL